MTLAIFDLDNTLLGGDSDHAWGEFVCEQGLVDAAVFGEKNDLFYRDYQQGSLNIETYLRFVLSVLAGRTEEEVGELHRQFMAQKIEPMMLPKALALLDKHRRQGDRLLIITATSAFVTRPIAERLGVSEILACEAEIKGGRFSGAPSGIPTYREGKVKRLQEWLLEQDESLQGACFYSDSHNDLPLLELVDKPVAVDPDPVLAETARDRGWPVISLR